MRNLEDVQRVAETFGFYHVFTHEMPANNKIDNFQKIDAKIKSLLKEVL